MNKEDWISCKERYPDMELVSESNYIKTYCSKPYLIQTKKNGLFVAVCHKTISVYKRNSETYEWFSYGTGGRRMKVMSTVVAWMELPEEYDGE